MPTNKIELNKETLEFIDQQGYNLPELLWLNAYEARTFRSSDLFLYFQKVAEKAQKILSDHEKFVTELERYICELKNIKPPKRNDPPEKIIQILRQPAQEAHFHNLLKLEPPPSSTFSFSEPLYLAVFQKAKDLEKVFGSFFRHALNRKITVIIDIYKKNLALLDEYKAQIIDFEFIKAMESKRRRDQNVKRSTYDDTVDVMIKTAYRSAAQRKHYDLANPKKNKKTQKNLDDFNGPRPEKKVSKPKSKKDKKEGYT